MLKFSKFNKILSLTLIIFTITAFSIPAEAKEDKVIIGGEAFGLKLYCKGVMVTNLESFYSNRTKVCPAEKSGLQKNDVITKINGQTVKSNEKVSEIIKASGGKQLELTFEREDKTMLCTLAPKLNEDGQYCAGMWIRDSCAGIGTISFYNKSDQSYAALGHGICDIDTGGIMPSDSGEILKANITSVNKSADNNIGTLNGYFTNEVIGTVRGNAAAGIYGNISSEIDKREEVEIAEFSQIKTGSATMYSTISGTEPQPYSVEITKICGNDKASNRNFVVKIVDKRLLGKTGGIVQGMSGSPIIQNGRLVGALTHVFVESCNQGYGILAENMIDMT